MDDENDSNVSPESASLVSSTIMFRVPTNKLNSLRNDFEKAGHVGVNLVQFLFAFVKNMDLDSNDALIEIVPDLIDFFNLVDVNGDGHMEWSEFVMFVIEQVVQNNTLGIYERFDSISDMVIQPASSRSTATCCKFVSTYNKLFLGVANTLHIYSANPKSPTWLSLNVSIPMVQRMGNSTTNVQSHKKEDFVLKMDISDLFLIDSKDILCVLRSDVRIDFYKFMSRSKLLPETISCTSTLALSQSCKSHILSSTYLF